MKQYPEAVAVNADFVVRCRVENDDTVTDMMTDQGYEGALEFITFDTSSSYFGEFPADADPAQQNKTWWFVSLYRHGDDCWYLNEDLKAPLPCEFDTVRIAGFVRVIDKDIPNPKTFAQAFIEDFNAVSNGDTWGYRVSVWNKQLGVCPTCNCGDSFPQYQSCDEDDCGWVSVFGDDRCVELASEDIKVAVDGLLSRVSPSHCVAVSVEGDDISENGYLVSDLKAELEEVFEGKSVIVL